MRISIICSLLILSISLVAGSDSDIEELKSSLLGKSAVEKSAILQELVDKLRVDEPSEAIRFARERLQVVRMNKLSDGAEALKDIMLIFGQIGDFNSAIDYGKETLKAFEESKKEKDQCETFLSLANFYAYTKQYDKAVSHLIKARRIADINGYLSLKGDILRVFGIVCFYKRDYTCAKHYHSNFLKVKEELKDKQGVGNAHYNLGLVAMNLENFEESLKHLNRSLETDRELNNFRSQGFDQSALASLYLKMGQYDTSRKLALIALEAAEKLENDYLRRWTLSTLSLSNLGLGNSLEGVRFFEEFTTLSDKLAQEKLENIVKAKEVVSKQELDRMQEEFENQFVYLNTRKAIFFRISLGSGALAVVLFIWIMSLYGKMSKLKKAAFS